MRKLTIILLLLFFCDSLNGQNIEKKAINSFFEIVDKVNIHLSHKETFNFNKKTDRIFFSGETESSNEYKFPINFNKKHNSESFIKIDTINYKLDSFGNIQIEVEKKERIQLGKVRHFNTIEKKEFESKRNENDIFIEISNEIKYEGFSYFIVWIETKNKWCRNIVFLKLDSNGKLIDWVSEYGTL